MKCFIVQQQSNNRIASKNKILLMIILLVPLLLAMPVYAENSYLFPSDIIDQSEQSEYDVGRASRYAAQRKWAYPETSQTSEKKVFYPDFSEYSTIDSQPVAAQHQARPYQSQSYQSQDKHKQPRYNNMDSGSKLFDDSEYYKYSNFKANSPHTSQAELPYIPEEAPPLVQFSRELRYPGGNYVNQPGGRNIEREMKKDFVPQTEYIDQRKYVQSYPNLLYPSDMEINRRSVNINSHSPNSFSSSSFPANSFPVKNDYGRERDPTRPDTRIQYVPVPVYNVPGTLPGTIPGVVTPGKMVPGYSHLSPDYNYSGLNSVFRGSGFPGSGLLYGLQDQRLFNNRSFNNSGLSPFLGLQYNPLTGQGIFSGESKPFDTFYNHSQSISPFASQNSMVPGFSVPNIFSPY